jgi:hypothetical protein
MGIPLSQPTKKRSYRIYLLAALLMSIVSMGIFTSYALQSVSVPLEVKEPIEILDYPSGLSLFPGETVEFNITVQNIAPITYSRFLKFSLNDTDYQTKYVTFSHENYTIVPGTQTLSAWIKVSPDAPPTNLLISIDIGETPQISPTPSPPSSSELSPALELLGGGARWAAGNDSSALVINWKDSWFAHNLTDTEWGPWPSEPSMNNWSLSISQALEQAGFKVESAGDIPENLEDYDLVVIHSYYAAEPKYEALIGNYVFNGGSVVLLSAVPAYFTAYCKNMWPGNNPLPEWLGTGYYTNAGGTATVTVNNPFSTALLAGDALFYTEGFSCAAIALRANNGQVVALWNSGSVFAFTNEYGQGRVYYQAMF